MLLVYVDDIIITGTDMAMIKDIQSSFHQSVHMKDLGPLTYVLDLEGHQSKKGLILDQNKYTMDIIEMVVILHSTPADTLLEVSLKLTKESGDRLSDPTTSKQLDLFHKYSAEYHMQLIW